LYDAIVLGAGPNGLVLAAYLAKAGLTVAICEKRLECGGGLSTEEHPFAPGFYNNIHSIYHMTVDFAPPYTDLGLSEMVDYEFPPRQVAFPLLDGKCIVLSRDVEDSAKSIARFSEKDAKSFREMTRKYDELMQEYLIPLTYLPPIPPLELADKMSSTPLGREFLRLSELSALEVVEETFEDDRVQALFLYLACSWGIRYDEGGMGFLVPLFINRATNLRLCRGGSHRLASALIKIILRNNGMIHDNSRVTKIMVENGQAKGVELWDGRKIEAKIVASSVNHVQTLRDYVGPEHLSHDLVDELEGWQWEESSLFNIYAASNANLQWRASQFDPAIQDAFMTAVGFQSTDELKRCWDEIAKGKIPVPIGNLAVPSHFDHSQAPDGKSTIYYSLLAPYNLEGISDGWDAQKKQFTAEALERLREYATNLQEENLIASLSLSPLDIERKFTNMVRGSIKQGAYVPTQMGYFRPSIDLSSYRTPIKGLYLCGASSYPGGLVTFGPGYNCAGVIIDDIGKSRWWTYPENIEKTRRTLAS
jgi:phytoene dehydrogenase-like protein